MMSRVGEGGREEGWVLGGGGICLKHPVRGNIVIDRIPHFVV
jgi:hypothetical protein